MPGLGEQDVGVHMETCLGIVEQCVGQWPGEPSLALALLNNTLALALAPEP